MEKEIRMTLRLPNELKEKINIEAKIQNRSIHNLILTILYEYFKNKPQAK